MKKLTRALFLSTFLCFSLAVPLSAQTQKAASLKPGDQAPALVVSDWVKGKEVDSLEKGTIYVLEFWATWCGPCVAVIPHVTELQKQYKDVVFIGMNVWERKPEAVPPFLKKMGDKMDYRVAMDKDDTMANTWMKAAGQSGIPCSFIVDKDGKIAWIGHPSGLDSVIEKVVDGSYDVATEMKRIEARRTQEEAYSKAMEAKDWDGAIDALTAIGKADPSMNTRVQTTRFNILLRNKKDADAAHKLGASFPKLLQDDAEGLNQIAWLLIAENGTPSDRDIQLAKKLAARGVKITDRKEAAVLDTLARVYFEEGNRELALNLQKESVAAAGGRMKAELEKTLKRYEESNQKALL